MRWVVIAGIVCLAGAACGRRNFNVPDANEDVLTIDAAIDAMVPIDGPPVCADGDSVCVAACIGMDTDCNTTCGDGTCVGNAGELCNTCASDCKTTNTVCGNGACEGSEVGCYADCGPGAWTWTAEEAQLIMLINQLRTGGYKCPGTPGPAVTLPALTVDPALKAPAREWAWEMAHQSFFTQDGSACNGRDLSQRYAAGNFTAYNNGFNFADVTATFNDWISNSASCTVVMSDVNTTMNVGVAFDVAKGYVFILK